MAALSKSASNAAASRTSQLHWGAVEIENKHHFPDEKAAEEEEEAEEAEEEEEEEDVKVKEEPSKPPIKRIHPNDRAVTDPNLADTSWILYRHLP